jgi:hypothetical protein
MVGGDSGPAHTARPASMSAGSMMTLGRRRSASSTSTGWYATAATVFTRPPWSSLRPLGRMPQDLGTSAVLTADLAGATLGAALVTLARRPARLAPTVRGRDPTTTLAPAPAPAAAGRFRSRSASRAVASTASFCAAISASSPTGASIHAGVLWTNRVSRVGPWGGEGGGGASCTTGVGFARASTPGAPPTTSLSDRYSVPHVGVGEDSSTSDVAPSRSTVAVGAEASRTSGVGDAGREGGVDTEEGPGARVGAGGGGGTSAIGTFTNSCRVDPGWAPCSTSTVGSTVTSATPSVTSSASNRLSTRDTCTDRGWGQVFRAVHVIVPWLSACHTGSRPPRWATEVANLWHTPREPMRTYGRKGWHMRGTQNIAPWTTRRVFKVM